MHGTEKNKTAPATATERPQLVKVWDLVVRLGHWAMAIAFAIAYLRYRKFPLHALMGYAIFGIVVWRIVWGFIGSRYARFAAFIHSPREIIDYTLSALRMGPAPEYASHNPMGALMVFTILPTLLVLCVLGMLLYSAQQLSGPFGDLVPTDWEYYLQEAHGFVARFMLVLISIHVAGVVWASWWHRQNYIWSMITGNKAAHQRRAKRRSAADRRAG